MPTTDQFKAKLVGRDKWARRKREEASKPYTAARIVEEELKEAKVAHHIS